MPGEGYARDDDANYQQGKIQLLAFYFFLGLGFFFLGHALQRSHIGAQAGKPVLLQINFTHLCLSVFPSAGSGQALWFQTSPPA